MKFKVIISLLWYGAMFCVFLTGIIRDIKRNKNAGYNIKRMTVLIFHLALAAYAGYHIYAALRAA